MKLFCDLNSVFNLRPSPLSPGDSWVTSPWTQWLSPYRQSAYALVTGPSDNIMLCDLVLRIKPSRVSNQTLSFNNNFVGIYQTKHSTRVRETCVTGLVDSSVPT